MPSLTTERLVLRPLHVIDARDMYEYACREDLTKYLLWSPHSSLSFTQEYLSFIQSRYRAGDFFDLAIILKSQSKMIGTVGFTRIDISSDLGEIGYVINPEYHRQGLGFEAASKILEYGFDTLNLHRIEVKFMRGNDASFALAKKLGMTFEGYHRDSMLVKGEYKTIGYCSILREEYRQNKQK